MKTGLQFRETLSLWGRGFTTSLLAFAIIGAFAPAEARTARTLKSDRSELRSDLLEERSTPKFSNDRFTIEGRMGVGSQYLTDEFNEGASAAFGGNSRIKYKFLDNLELNAEVAVQFSAERFQSQFDSDDFADGFWARRFDVKYLPIKYLQFGFGGINQKEFVHTPLLVSNRAFPGVYQQINIGGVQGQTGLCNCVFLRASQLMPTSRSFDTDRQEKEEDPFLSTISLVALLNPNKHLTFQPFIRQFRFQNLPSIVAFRSRLRGNSVLGETAPDSSFAFAFEGYVAGGLLTIKPTSKLQLELGYQQIENTSAPDTVNSGALAFVRPKIRFGGTEFKPIAGAYYNEPDTAPGMYNDGDFGHNNREGSFYGFEIDFNDFNFRLAARVYEANVINKDDFNFQTDQTYAVFSLETIYVEF